MTVLTMITNRQTFLSAAAAAAGAAALPAYARAADARTVKVGMLKTVNTVVMQFYQKFAPPGVTYQVIAFDTPPDGKDAVVSGSVDFGIFGLAAATLGAAAGQPLTIIAAAGGKAMALVVAASSTAKTFADLKGKKIAYQPGSTQEVVLRELMKMASMTAADVQLVRLSFGDMANALARGDVDAYLGSEPGPSISVLSGKGKVLLYPYNTPVGLINVVFATRPDLIAKDPAYVREMVKVHVAACKWSSNPANRTEFEAMTTKILGPTKEQLDLAMNNINFDYAIDADYLAKAKYYGAQMVTLKEIAAVPDYATFFNTSFLPK
jgi:ABC-type nitrate/sulfonate/bicarbonate transport system substrate-binding protein